MQLLPHRIGGKQSAYAVDDGVLTVFNIIVTAEAMKKGYLD